MLSAKASLSSSSSPGASSSENSSFAFVVHSLETIPRNLPPTVDNKPLARQRRKRTSPEDQIILEQEFQRDAKPDKAARARIVRRVALGEKEVQIWFQNRRQTSRRRSQPIFTTRSQEAIESHSRPTSKHESNDNDVYEVGPSPSEHSNQSITLRNTREWNGNSENTREAPSRVNGQESQQDFSQSSTSTIPLQDESECVDPSSEPTRRLKRTSSGIRLSFTSQGDAKILGEFDPSPSPGSSPGPVDRISNTHQGLGPIFTHQSLKTRPSLPSGHSWDSRRWESTADGDSRNDLLKKANQESTGSAAEAISCMRSSSNRRVLATITDRFRAQGEERNPKRAKRSLVDISKRPKLIRSLSAATDSIKNKSQNFTLFDDNERTVKHQEPQKTSIFISHGSDSDKENNDPNARSGLASTRRGSKTKRPTLKFNHTAPDRPRPRFKHDKSNTKNSSTRNSQSVARFDPERDAELSTFMRSTQDSKGNKTHDNCAGEDDLDCIQGLLSLSQGNWK